MARRRRGIRDTRRNLLRESAHRSKGRSGKTEQTMRVFYLIVTALLLITLGLLEVVAARSVPVGP
jgi:hypothetical protein